MSKRLQGNHPVPVDELEGSTQGMGRVLTLSDFEPLEQITNHARSFGKTLVHNELKAGRVAEQEGLESL